MSHEKKNKFKVWINLEAKNKNFFIDAYVDGSLRNGIVTRKAVADVPNSTGKHASIGGIKMPITFFHPTNKNYTIDGKNRSFFTKF